MQVIVDALVHFSRKLGRGTNQLFGVDSQRDFFEYLNRNLTSSFSCSVGTIVVTIRTAIVMPAGP